MRVIAGTARGIRLASVPGESTRPITDRVKEALFNILGPSIVDARVLDLFAGTGSVGIEALSRGARRAVFVERDRRALATIRRNLAATHLAERAEVVAADVFGYLSHPPAEPFDLIYIAPPQYRRLWVDTLRALDRPGYLAAEGVAVVQVFPKEDEPVPLRHLVRGQARRYGSTLLVFYHPANREGEARAWEGEAPAWEGEAPAEPPHPATASDRLNTDDAAAGRARLVPGRARLLPSRPTPPRRQIA